MIRILLAEDQAMVRGALQVLLNMEDDIEVVYACENGRDALTYLEQNTVDIVLTDIEMPDMNGIELIERLSRTSMDVRKVVVTTFGKAGYIKRAISAGVDGFLLKDAQSDELIEALRIVMTGKRVIDNELALSALDDVDPLTDKERKALALAADGKKTQEIAELLFLSVGTVRNYLSEAISKLNAANRIDAARIARQKGWL